MPTARTHITEPKTIVSATAWRSGDVPKKHALFFRKPPYVTGPNWLWREATLAGDNGREYRLLVLYLPAAKKDYKAWLSIKIEGDKKPQYALVARYECHGNHGALHCHILCHAEHYPIGDIKPCRLSTFPSHRKKTGQKVLGLISKDEAWRIASKFYRIGAGDLWKPQ